MPLRLRKETHTSDRNPARDASGFTLLEVLAAVAILAIWYVVIAAMATDGLRKQGLSLRLMEASGIANRYMAEIEASTLDGTVPPLRDEETEEGDFLVHIFIVPFGFGVTVDKAVDPGRVGGKPGSPDLKTLLKSEMPGINRHLVSINVRVSWEEGPDERSVRRSSYAFNLAEARNVYQSKDAKEAAEAEKEEASEEDVDDLEIEDFQG